MTAETWLILAPFATLLAIYCWDYGMDLLVPVATEDVAMKR